MTRDIPHAFVVQTIMNPGETRPGDYPDSVEAIKDFNGYEVHVVYVVEENAFKVITVWKVER